MLQHFFPYNYLNIQPLVDAVNKLAEPSGWVIAQTIISGIAVILSLVLALGAWRRSSWKNWLKIKSVNSSILYQMNKQSLDFVGLSIDAKIERNHEIPMGIYAAAVNLHPGFALGYKKISDDNIFIGPIQFQLIRTGFHGPNLPMHEMLPADEFDAHVLRDKDFYKIKKGTISIITNTGTYQKRLSKEEIGTFIKTFKDVKEFMKN